jgi:hypothetical protein
MDRNYIQLKNNNGVMVKQPKKKTIELLLSYSKALKILKVSNNEEYEMILN